MSEPVPASIRNAAIVSSVMVLHIAALWALQTGLLRRAVEIIVPVQVLSEFITPAVPKVEPPPLPKPPEPVKERVVHKTAPALAPAPMPLAIADPTPATNAPTGTPTPPVPLPPIAAPVAEAAAPTAPSAPPPRVDLPSSDADYLQNPKPAYPPLSKRLGEQGKVVVRVLIGPDGTAHQVELRQSSGYERLDQAA